MRLIIPLVLCAALIVLFIPGSAAAHAEIVSSTPKGGSTVDAAPEAVTASFNQKLGPDESSLTVVDAQGTRVDNDDSAVDPADADGKTMRVTLKGQLAAGTYTVEWKTLSAEDGEATDGQFQFTVRAGAAASASASAAPSASARPAASATASAAASSAAAPTASAVPTASAAGGAQPGALPATGATGQPLGLFTIVAGLLLVLGLLLGRGLKH